MNVNDIKKVNGLSVIPIRITTAKGTRVVEVIAPCWNAERVLATLQLYPGGIVDPNHQAWIDDENADQLERKWLLAQGTKLAERADALEA